MAQDFTNFVRQLKLEAIALAILMVVLTRESGYSLWVLPLSFMVFDIGALGYVFNSRVGAMTYNFMHNYTVPTLLIAWGVWFDQDVISVIGFAWIFHISVDRALSFGLKHKHSFQDTHLGLIGKKNQ